MKKMMQVVFAFVVSFCLVTTVNAETNNSKLLDYARSSHKIAGKDVKLSNEDLRFVETFLRNNDISDAEAEIIIARADEMVAVLDEAGVTSVNELSKAKKDQIFALGREAAAVIGATLDYDNSEKAVVITNKYGKKSVYKVPEELTQTGKSNILVTVAFGVIALGATAVVVRKKQNA